MKTDIHQHLWTEPLVQALAQRREFPFVRDEHGLTVLYLAGERPYVIDLASEAPARRAELVRGDGLDRALVCLSSPLGIESLPRARRRWDCSTPTTRARSRSASPSACGVRLRSTIPTPTTSTARSIAAASVSRCPPARSPASIGSPACARYSRAWSAAARRCSSTPGRGPAPATARDRKPLPAPVRPRSAIRFGGRRLREYIADMHTAFLTFLAVGRAEHPELRVVFSMLAGLAPLHAERLAARGGPDLRRRSERGRQPVQQRHGQEAGGESESGTGTQAGQRTHDPLVFYDTSSYGPLAIGALTDVIGGPGQLLYGSDRPVVEPELLHEPGALDWDLLADTTARAFGSTPPAATHDRGRAPEVAAAAQNTPNVPVAREEALR